MIAELAPGFTIRKCKTGCLLLAIETRQTRVCRKLVGVSIQHRDSEKKESFVSNAMQICSE